MLTSKGIRNLFKVLLLVGLSLLFMTCDPGLGKAVDTQAPKVSITLPATKSVLKGGFTMKGIASDEVKVESCTVTFKNIKTSQEYNFNATVSGGEFKVNINTPKPNGTFELPDGDYNVTVTVTDAYHKSTADVVYTIDNTSPTVLLTSPNVYVESNWPSMYKIFTIKGEVYDFTTISEVKVFIVDSEGKVIVEQIAEGTNTFLASFDNPGIPTGKTCFYYAVAKDAGGNENTYCYHKQDIYALISQQQKNSTFPSINAIGYVDQNVEDTFNGSIDKNLLGAKKIENVKPGAEKGSRPGFDFFDKDTAQIKWMNISDESLAGIGIGTPILGTIMPPTDGSAVLDVKVWLVKGEEISDNEFSFPEYTDSDEIETCWLSYDDEGNIKDEKQCKLSSVGDSVNFQIDSHDVGSGDEWPSALYKIKVQFITNSDMEGYAECKFQVTSGAPKLTEGNFSSNPKASYYRGFMTAKTLDPSSDEKNYLKGVSRTSDDSAKVSLYYEFTGPSDGNNYAEMDEYGNYKIEIPIDAVNHTKDGEYTYTLTSKVSELLSTVISRVVVIDTTNPTIEFTTLSNGDIIESSEFNLKGNVEDANGISEVEYQLLADSSQILIDGSQTNGWQVIPNAKSSFNLSLSNLKEDVTYTVKIRATDMAGNISEDEKYKCSFTIDLAEPVATIDSPAPEADSSIVFTNQIPTFSGKAIDNAKTNGKVAKSASLSFRKDGGSVTEVPAGTGEGQFNWNKNSGEWTWTPTSSQFNGTGKYDVTLKVTDTAEKSISVTRTVSLDNSVPTIKLTQVSSYVERENPEDGYYVNGEISVKFDITENDYIKEIKWYKPNGSVDSQNLGTNAQPTVVIKTTDFDDGTKLGEFKLVVTDRSGNEGVYTGEGLLNYEINQDSDKPTIEISGINENITTVDGISKDDNLFSTGDSLSLTFKDDDGVASAKYRIDSDSEKTINGGNVKVKTDNISLNGLTQGSHTIKVTVTDTNGNTISTNTIYFGIDDKSPELNIDGYSETDIDVGFKSSNFEITGTVTDTYELKDLVYSYSDTPDVKTKIRDGNGNWNLSITKPDSSEKKTITFVASDKFLRTTVKTFTYIFDLDNPNLIIPEEQKTAITDKYFNQNTIVTLSGTANDISGDTSIQSGIKFVQYGLGKGHDATSTDTLAYQNANGSTEWTVLLNIPTFKDGKYTLFVKSVDNSGNESDVQKFNITADSTAPILTVGGSSDASGTSYASGDLNLSGTVADETLLNLTYTYTLNGQEQESDVVINTSGSGNEKTWSLSKGELGDGTHVFKIFATDKAGNQTSLTRNIIVDTEAPVITTNVSPLIMYNNGNGEEETVNGTINVNVRVSETNKLKGVYYTLTESDRLDDAADWSSKASFKDTELATGKTITIVTTNYDDGTKLPLRIKAVDEAGNYSVVEVKPVVNQASDQPTFTPSNFEELDNENVAGWSNGAPKNVFGDSSPNMIFTIADDDSVKECWVKVDTGDFKKLDKVVTSTQQIVTYPVKELGYGRHTITFKVIDTNCSGINSAPSNNYVQKTYYIANDKEAPKIELTNTNGQFVGEQFTLSGKVTDENGIKSVILSSEDGNTTYATLTLGSGFDVDGKFSHDFQLAQLDKKSIRVIAVDGIGNQSENIFTYVVDSTAPNVSFIALENNYINNDHPTINVEGTANDVQGQNDTGVSKLSKVLLKIDSEPTGIDDAECITANGIINNDGSMNWSSSLNFTGKPAKEYFIYAQAFDIAGNKSAVAKIPVYVDDDNPVFNLAGYTENVVGVFKDAFTISGSVSDNSGIKSVTAKIQGASNNLGVKTYDVGIKEGNWSFSVPKSTGEGKITILVTAEDICGKTTTETLTATLDVGVPEITFTDIDDDDEGIKTSKTTENPRVSITYSDITSGIVSMDYTFWYFDKAQGKYVNKHQNTFVPSNPFSGTLVIQMGDANVGFISKETKTDGQWYVELTAKDNAGNITELDSPCFYVDMHRPSLTVTSPSPTVSLKKQNDEFIVEGYTTDEKGGEIDRVVVKIKHDDYKNGEPEKFTKTFTLDGRNETETFTVNGNNYNFIYTWTGDNSPFIYPDVYEIFVTSYDKAGNEKEFSQKISCDNTAPVITFSRPYSYAVDANGNITPGTPVYSPIGETNIKASVSDYSPEAIYYQIGGTVEIIPATDTEPKKYRINNGGLVEGDENGSVPGSYDSLVNGILLGNWFKLNKANLDFDISYNTRSFFDNGKTYHVNDDRETIMTLDVHLIAVDTAGNINYCKYPLKIDTDTDKPNLLILSPKTDNENVANVGGIATVSGTVNDDNAVHSVLMQVELVKGNYGTGTVLKGNGDSTFGIDYSTNGYEITNPQVLLENDGTYSLEDTNSYFSDKSKWYKVKLGAEGSTSTIWNMVINKNKEFDNASLHGQGFLTEEVKQTELIIRVRALDTKPKNKDNSAVPVGAISDNAKLGEVQEFTLKIDSGSPSIDIKNIEDFPTEGSYIGGNFDFNVEFTDDEQLTEYSIIAYSTANGNDSQYVIAQDSNALGLGAKKTVTTTIDTADIFAECGNMIQIKFYAKDNSVDSNGQSAAKESFITFKYIIDNSAPTAKFIDGDKYLNTEAVKGTLREPENRGGHLRILSNQAAFKGNVTDESNGSGIDYVMLYFTKGDKIYNPSIKEEHNTAVTLSHSITVHDKDDNEKVIKFPVASVRDIAKSKDANGGQGTPYIVIDRAEAWDDDGPNGDLDGYDENLKANGEWVVYIDSKNIPDGLYDIHYVVVDQAKNARYYTDSMLVQNNAPTITSIVLATDINGDDVVNISSNGTSDEDQKFDTSTGFTNTKFTVRNSQLKIKVNAEGGTGTKKFFLRYQTENGIKETNSENDGYFTGEFYVTDFKSDSSTAVDYVVWVEDSVESNLSLSSGESTIDMILENNDDVKPVAQFFELNTDVEDSFRGNSQRGSLYKSTDSVQGHIETRKYSKVDNATVTDPEVSGTIILRGEVMDNQRITSITLTLNEIDYVIASWNSTSKKLEAKNNNAVIVDDLNLSGHYVEWSYAWDTNSITKYNVPVKLTVQDVNQSSSAITFSSVSNTPRVNVGTEDNRFTYDGWGYNSMTVDVVPYITNIETNITNTAGAEFARSAQGYYIIASGDDFTIHGFNLGGTSSTVNLGSVSLTKKSGNNNYITVSSGTNTKTGELEVLANGIYSINNINTNAEFDTSGNIIGGAEYNSQANNITNNRLTDDCNIYVWDMGFFVKQTDITSPVMKMGPDGKYYMSYGYGVPRMYLNNNGTTREVDYSYNKFHNTMVGFDESGNIYGLATNTDRVNNSSAKFVFYTEMNIKDYDDEYGSPSYQSSSDYKRHLEQVYNYKTGVYDINRVKTPKMYIRGAGTSANPAKVAISYFDANNTISPVKFRYGTVANKTTISGGIEGNTASSSSSGAGESNNPNTMDSSAKGYHIVASSQTNYQGGAYSAVGLTSGGVAVVAWYDASRRALIYSYNTNPNTPVVGGAWQSNAIVIDDSYAGWYVDMTVDENDGIHIAYYNIGKGDLKYAYLSSYNATPQVVTVDSYLSTGTNIVINTRKENDKCVPYISYYHAASAQTPNSVRIAWRKDFSSLSDGVISDKFTGSWEVMTVPADNIPVELQICNGVPKSGTYSSTVVLGYMSDVGYEKAYIKY